MSSPSYETKVRPSAGWYGLVAVLWIASAVVFSVMLIKPIVDVFGTDLSAFANGDPVSVGTDGVSVYAEDDDQLGVCTMTSEDGVSNRMRYLDFSKDFEIETTGPTLAPYASSPDGLPAGTYTIECDGGDTTVLATGNRIDEDSLERNVALGFIFASILGLLGVVLLIVLLVRRHNSKSRIRSAQAAAYYGAWPPQPGYDPYQQQAQPTGYDPYWQQQQQQQQPPAYDPYGQQPSQPPYDPYGPQGQQQQPPAYDPYGQQGHYAQQPPQPGQPSDQGYGTPEGYSAPQQSPYGQPAPSNDPSGGYPAPDSPPDSSASSYEGPNDSGSSDSGTTDSGSSDSGSSDSGSGGSSDSNNN